MKEIFVNIPVAATTADLFYIPVPCRGNIASGWAVYNQETDEDEVVTINRDDTAVMTFEPPADGTAEGVMIEGASNATNGQLIFDPDSSTTAYQVIEVSIPDTFDTAGVLGLCLQFDDGAYVEQESVQA